MIKGTNTERQGFSGQETTDLKTVHFAVRDDSGRLLVKFCRAHEYLAGEVHMGGDELNPWRSGLWLDLPSKGLWYYDGATFAIDQKSENQSRLFSWLSRRYASYFASVKQSFENSIRKQAKDTAELEGLKSSEKVTHWHFDNLVLSTGKLICEEGLPDCNDMPRSVWPEAEVLIHSDFRRPGFVLLQKTPLWLLISGMADLAILYQNATLAKNHNDTGGDRG